MIEAGFRVGSPRNRNRLQNMRVFFPFFFFSPAGWTFITESSKDDLSLFYTHFFVLLRTLLWATQSLKSAITDTLCAGHICTSSSTTIDFFPSQRRVMKLGLMGRWLGLQCYQFSYCLIREWNVWPVVGFFKLYICVWTVIEDVTAVKLFVFIFCFCFLIREEMQNVYRFRPGAVDRTLKSNC